MSSVPVHLPTKPGFTCLVVEDDPGFAAMTSDVITSEGGKPTHCGTLAMASDALARHSFDIILLDNHLPDGKAYDLFGLWSRRNPEIPIIMITGLPAVNEAVSLTRNGLFEYLTKPVEVAVLVDCLRRARLRIASRQTSTNDAGCIGSSPAMRGVVRQLEQAAAHPTATVLLTGESGTGKDVAARTLHALTSKGVASMPYVAINCAAVPGDMLESELFGAERGAFTGADRRRQGLVASAMGGTLFLDEVGDVPLASQAKLLRLLEGGEFRSLGGEKSQKFTGRFVGATNKSLSDEVKAGRFREDLLYRIEVFTIEIPPLRQRREDIPELAEHLLRHLAKRYDRPAPQLRPDDLALLQQHSFPGNIRELRNILERALLRTAPNGHWLEIQMGGGPTQASGSIAAPRATPSPPAAVSMPPVGDPLPTERLNLSAMDAQEYRLIRSTLAECHGGIRRTATKLGMSPQALLRRLEKWPELRQAVG